MTMIFKPKVLLVDDREENLVALEGLLSGHDVDLLRAGSGEQALELLLAHEVALALVDVHMPDMDGFELAELMRGAERTREVPIIFITAGIHDQKRIFKGYDSGAVDFLFKPLDPHILSSKVAVFMQLYRQKQQLAERVRELERALAERQQIEAKLNEQGERLREADRRKDEFLAMLAHELRNPLAPVLNAVHILRRVGSNEARLAWCRDVIGRQVEQLTRLVDDLLDVSRITRGKIELRKEPVDLAAIVQRAVETSLPLIDAHRHRFLVELPSEPVRVEGDPIRLAQVVSNLLNNAAKYTDEGGSIGLRVEAAGREVFIRVRDTGRGIDPSALPHLFELFYQVDRTPDRSEGGLGIGLSLVRSLVAMHGGEIRAYSEGRGRGSEFVIRLPQSPDPSAGTAREPAAAGHDRPEPGADGGLRLLVVDDNHDAAESLALLLRYKGHAVTTAADGPSALEMALAERPEVVLLDIGLPGMDGYAVARELRQCAELHGTLLVALTGYGQPEDREKSRAAGFDRHFVKPIDFEVLQGLIAEFRGRED
jgi:signal transduction histidine kinase